MTIANDRLLRILYEGRPIDKLATAEALHAELAPRLKALPPLAAELDGLRLECRTLAGQMEAMQLGRLCSRCAARPDGGCCSALMADNTDALQILINLLLDVPVAVRSESGENCCFLGPTGCPFPAKPIFCLNYNCSHILTGAAPADLAVLYRRAATVLSRQTRIEDLLLDAVRDRIRPAP
ncbi:hypothetical protein [Desulfobulbus sp.]|uniref:hypothetical protein n=1 Tax=Desulfobulbus sp. TaxID=895 RepID=UPI00286EFEB2|nr:hypothetical protein [Desulfobulbus sp.]